MQAFKALFAQLDRTSRTSEKEKALREFFEEASDEVVIHGIHALMSKRDNAPASTSQMKKAVKSVTGVSDELYQRCYDAVGDTAEAISLLIPVDQTGSEKTLVDWYRELRRLQRAKSYQKPVILRDWYTSEDPETLFLVNKLITSAFRVGVSEKTVVNALADHHGIDEDILLHRLIGDWSPDKAFYEDLTAPVSEDERAKKPYPFCLCYAVDDPEESLDDIDNYVFEWKYDGIRAQVLCRDDVYIWSRSGEPLNETFPEILEAGRSIEDNVVLDGEILAYDDDPLSFQTLQRRLGRRNPSQGLKSEVPVVFIVYDILEADGNDLRQTELHQRRGRLETVDLPSKMRLAEQQWFDSWTESNTVRSDSRQHGVEGFIVKHIKSVYHSGRKKQGWWKWKLDPFTLDVVLLYAQTGHGRRSGLYTDYTFGVWDGDDLVPIAKAYSGLTDDAFEELDRWIRGNTVAQHGPVREVEHKQVFEIAFQGIYENDSKKSGYATRFPRIKRWREGKPVEEADTIKRCEDLVASYTE